MPNLEEESANKKTLIISDVHLVSGELEKTNLFIRFCKNEAQKADQVFILGDLFNTWLGDDLSIQYYQEVVYALKSLSKNTDIFVLVGNRDFLLGKLFEEKSGCRVLKEPYLLKSNNKKYVLIHGDTLCTDDIDYQRLKKLLQNKITINIFLNLPTKLRLKLSGQLRKKSIEAKSYKSREIMDVNENAVNELMKKYPNSDLIHGHTHRQDTHNEDKYNRYVLGEWSGLSGSAIKLEDALSFIEVN